MAARRDKGLAVARYLTAATGIVGFRWNGQNIDSPAPYVVHLTTSRKLQNWTDALTDSDTLGFAIRYDYSLPELAEAWVGMKLETFAMLLQAYHERTQHASTDER